MIDSASPRQPNSGLPFAVLIPLLLLGALVVFGPVVGYPLLWDDKYLIRDNHYLVSFSGLWDALKGDFWAVPGADAPSGMYRPVVTLSHFLEHLVAGKSSWAAHTTNLVLHLSNSALLALLLQRLSLGKTLAILSASLFAFHPVMVEPVANVSARTDSLAAFFLLAAVHLRLGRSGLTKESLAAVSMLLALLAKEQALVALPLFALLDYAREPQAPWRLRLYRLAGPAAATVVYVVLRWLALGAVLPFGAPGLPGVRPWQPWDGPVLTAWYALHALIPAKLSPVHPYPAFGLGVGCLSLAGLLTCGWAVRRYLGKPAVFGVLWFSVALVPVAAWFPLQVRVSDLFLYIPLAGAIPAAVLTIANKAPRATPSLWTAVGVFAILSATQASVWQSDRALWGHAALRNPTNPSVLTNLGNALHSEGRILAATEVLTKAVEAARRQGDPKSLAYASFTLCNIARETGRLHSAEACYTELLGVTGGRMPQVWINLGVTRLALQDLDGACRAAERALELESLNPSAHNLLGAIAASRGDFNSARDHFHAALEIAPSDENTLNNLARLRTAIGSQ